MDWVSSGVVFLFGLCIGSFLNVCIHRMPRGESIVHPGSHCPACSKPIRWYQNIPVFSYVILRGRCAGCGAGIAPRYVLIELLTASLWLLIWIVYGRSGFFVPGIILISILLAVTATDFETGFIPDRLTFPGMAAGLVMSAIFPELHGRDSWLEGIVSSVIGFLVGGGFLYAIGWIGNLIYKKETMGGGDIKLLAMIGTFLGFQETLLVFFFSPILALPVGLYTKWVRKEETIPFGPYLAITAGIFYFYGDTIRRYFFYTP